MKLELTKHSLICHGIGVLLLIMSLADILQNKVFLILYAALSVIIFITCYPFKKTNYFSESLLFILVILITSIINLFFTKNNFGGSLTLIGSLLVSFLYINFNSKKITIWVVLSYVITIGYIFYHLFVLGTHENLIYEGLSRNHVGFAVVFWTIFLLFHFKTNYNYILLLPPIVGLVLSFFLVGRTSLIVSALLVILVFYYKFRRKPVIRIVIFGTIALLSYFLWYKFQARLLSDTNLDAGLDTPRWELWRIYYESIDFVNLFTGVDVTTLRMYDIYSGNPHNSFIKFHSRTGLGCLIFLVLFFISLTKYIQIRQNYIFGLLFLLTLRAMFDGDILIGNFDFIFLILTFYWIKTDLYEPYHINSNRSVQ